MFGKIVDGKLVYAPVDLIKPDGTVIFGYYNNKDNAIADGYKRVINKTPKYDPATQIVKVVEYLVSDISITIIYEVITLEDRDEQMNECLVMFAQTLSDEDAMKVSLVYPDFKQPNHYKVNDKFRYNGTLYKVLQEHDTQDDWNPTNAPSLYAKVLSQQPGEDIPQWEQPDSANGYMTGDKVIFENKTYESLIDNNIWSPSAYPAGWKEVN